MLRHNLKRTFLRKPFVRYNQQDTQSVKKIIEDVTKKLYDKNVFRPDAVHVTTLTDGFTLIALDDNVPVSTLSLFVKAGSRYENSKTVGSTHFLKRLAFRSTEKKYFLQLIRDVDVRGSEYGCVNTKEYMGYYVSGLRTTTLNMFATLGSVYEPRLEEWEVREAKKDVIEDTISVSENPVNVIFENLHYEAFRDSPLSNPLYCPRHQFDEITNLTLREYVNTHYQTNRMFVVGSGVSMGTLLQYTNQYMSPVDVQDSIHRVVGKELDDFFPILTKPTTINDKKSTYIGGGEVRMPGSGNTYIAIAYEGVGETNTLESLTASILKFILGGGYELQKGFIPGLGLSSRLGTQVQNIPWLLQANAFNLTYPETGLFGIFAEATRGNVPELTKMIQNEMQSLTKVTEEEVERAKNQLKFSLLDTLTNDRFALTEFLVSQVDIHGKAKTPTEYITQIDQITVDQVRKLAEKIVSSKPVVSIIGDVEGLPRL